MSLFRRREPVQVEVVNLPKAPKSEPQTVRHAVEVTDLNVTFRFKRNGKTESAAESFKSRAWFNSGLGWPYYVKRGVEISDARSLLNGQLIEWRNKDFRLVGSNLVRWHDFVGADIEEVKRTEEVTEVITDGGERRVR